MIKNRKNRKIIEIYFVLYLAALILLIPGKNSEQSEDKNNSIFQIPFSIKIEKASLNAIVKIDSNRYTILTLDTVNNIFYTGNVRNVEYEFLVEDAKSNLNFTLKKDNIDQSQIFNFTQNNDDKSAKFRWKPNFQDRRSKSFIVTVLARAISEDSATKGQHVEDKMKFSINLTYDNQISQDLISNNNLNVPIINPQPINVATQYAPQGNLLLLPREENIRTIAYSDFENEVSIFGLTLQDLRKQPELKIIREPDDKIGGNAKIAGYRENSIIIKGEAPGYGTMRLFLTVIRHSDGVQQTKEIKVMPQLIDDPTIPDVCYPGINYQINPKMPSTSSQSSFSIITDKEGKTYARSQNNAPISFIAQITDTGKTLFLERYVDNNLLGQKYPIRIQNFPKPEIYRINETANNQVRIYTNSYGLNNRNPNYIKTIELIEGNAKIREIIGAQQAPDNKNLIYKQVFEIVPSDASKPFRFKIRAVSENGNKSEIKQYQRD